MYNMLEGLSNNLKTGKVEIAEQGKGFILNYDGQLYSNEVCDILFNEFDKYEALQDQTKKFYKTKDEANKAKAKLNKLTSEIKRRGYSNIEIEMFLNANTGRYCFLSKFYLGTEFIETTEDDETFFLEEAKYSDNCKVNFYIGEPNLTKVVKMLIGEVITKEDMDYDRFYYDNDKYSHTELYLKTSVGKDLAITLHEKYMQLDDIIFVDIENNQVIKYISDEDE